MTRPAEVVAEILMHGEVSVVLLGHGLQGVPGAGSGAVVHLTNGVWPLRPSNMDNATVFWVGSGTVPPATAIVGDVWIRT